MTPQSTGAASITASAPRVLAIIPTRNAGPALATTLERLRPAPVLILDTASTDGTPKLAQHMGAIVRTVAPEAFNHATTRNLALEYPAGWYLFLTQDAVPVDTRLVPTLLAAAADPHIALVYGRHLPPPGSRPEEAFARLRHYPPHSHVRSQADLPQLGIRTFFASNVCALYRGSVFRALGGFTPGLPTNEDMEFAARAILAGYRVAYCAQACVWHAHQLGYRDLWRRYRAIGRFFAAHPWITQAAGPLSGEGMAYVRAELAHLLRVAPKAIPRALLASAVKYLAFRSAHRL